MQYQKMDPVLKDKWLKGLRSGEYKQGKGFLRNEDNTHCCLGVLAEQIEGTSWEVEDGYYTLIKDGVACGVCGLCTTRLNLPSDFPSPVLIDFNDCDGKTFPEIADWVEENL